jgi:hypothetical protein
VEAHDRTEIEANGEIVVFSILKPSACAECGTELWKGSFLRMKKGTPLCLECADLDHLVFVPRGDTALARRSRKYSTLSAVVVRFSRSRKRYERQGLLVESGAIGRAREECLNDEEKRRIAQEKAALARAQADLQYVAQFTESIRSRYPDCPVGEAEAIAQHACAKYSGRIGRSAAAKSFDATALDLAVKAHVRHAHTEYDQLMSRGWERSEARSAVSERVAEIMERWHRE